MEGDKMDAARLGRLGCAVASAALFAPGAGFSDATHFAGY